MSHKDYYNLLKAASVGDRDEIQAALAALKCPPSYIIATAVIRATTCNRHTNVILVGSHPMISQALSRVCARVVNPSDKIVLTTDIEFLGWLHANDAPLYQIIIVRLDIELFSPEQFAALPTVDPTTYKCPESVWRQLLFYKETTRTRESLRANRFVASMLTQQSLREAILSQIQNWWVIDDLIEYITEPFPQDVIKKCLEQLVRGYAITAQYLLETPHFTPDLENLEIIEKIRGGDDQRQWLRDYATRRRKVIIETMKYTPPVLDDDLNGLVLAVVELRKDRDTAMNAHDIAIEERDYVVKELESSNKKLESANKKRVELESELAETKSCLKRVRANVVELHELAKK